MKQIFSFIALSLAILFISCSSKDDDPISPNEGGKETEDSTVVNYDKLSLIWQDEFEGTSIDMTKWNYRAEGTVRNYATVSKNTIVLDGEGHLNIKVTKDSDGKYYVGQLGTAGLFSATYGYFECRAQMNKYIGPHVAFWLQSPTMTTVGDPAKNGTEIDIFEYHRKEPDIVQHNLHWDGYDDDHQTIGMKINYPKVKEGFHTFGLKWTSKEYVFYVDGKETWRTATAVSQRSEYLILSTGLTGFGGNPELGTYPDKVIFDYVRVYKFKE
jgi:beta-glucanase (GH16 family)